MRKIQSYGGGLDSWAMLLYSIWIGEPPDFVAFCDVSNGSPEEDPTEPGEWDSTYRHIREVVMPLCEREGIEFAYIDTESYPVRGADALFTWFEGEGFHKNGTPRNGNVQIPVTNKKNRVCTIVAKVERFEAWMADRFPNEVCEVWIGFEAGEEKRCEDDPNLGHTKKKNTTTRINRFPLIEWGMCRCRCENFARSCGLPVARKSACTFCPYASRGDWRTLATERPDVFAKVVQLEARKREKVTGRSGVVMGIMGYKKADKWKGKKYPPNPVLGVDYKSPALPEYVSTGRDYKANRVTCGVCGQFPKAIKATGCTYLSEEEMGGNNRVIPAVNLVQKGATP